MIRAGNSLLKLGVIMMALAVAFVIAAAVVSVTLGSERGQVASEVRGSLFAKRRVTPLRSRKSR